MITLREQAFFATKNDETQGRFLLKTQKFSRNSSSFVKLKNTKNLTLKRSNFGVFYYNLSRFRSFLGLFRQNFNKNCSKSSKLSENFMKFNFVFEKLNFFSETQAKIFEKLKNTKFLNVGCLLKVQKVNVFGDFQEKVLKFPAFLPYRTLHCLGNLFHKISTCR